MSKPRKSPQGGSAERVKNTFKTRAKTTKGHVGTGTYTHI